MYLSYFDSHTISQSKLRQELKRLTAYRAEVSKALTEHDTSRPEYALGHAIDPTLHETLAGLQKQFAKIKHLILIGIGGSNIGTEAVHSVLDTGKVALHTLDTVSAHDIELLLTKLASVKKVENIAVCVISKSGSTTETMVNASVLLDALQTRYGNALMKQTLFIGDAGTAFMKKGQRLGVTCISMPKHVGGRYSVATEVGLVPLTLLGHDVDAFIAGVHDAASPEFEEPTAEAAARLSLYMTNKYRHYNFFAFEKRLALVGAWYRQLFAESLGKTLDTQKKTVTKGMVPTISTPVDLHSIGQLYLSGFAGVYTDFVTFDDDSIDYAVPKSSIGSTYQRFTVAEVATALYGGVMAAYQEKQLPYRATIFDEENIAYSLGLFMAMRMREVMYVANLLNVDAFDQPNVELYKQKTRTILKI